MEDHILKDSKKAQNVVKMILNKLGIPEILISVVCFIVESATPSKQPALPEQNKLGVTHLIILFDNQLDRTIKIVPSRSSRGMYFVEPRGYLMVNITIDSHDPFEAITFKSYDQEMATEILLNNSQSIKIKPSTNLTLCHNVTLTPQG